jgi:hypothetical protein
MKKNKLILLLIIPLLFACKNNTNKNKESSFFKTFIQDIPNIKLPVTYVVNQENDSSIYKEIDSNKAKQLQLEISENQNAYGWEIIGKIEKTKSIGIIYNLTYGNNYEKHITVFDTIGNKIDDLILMTNDVQYFSAVKEGFYQSNITTDYKINIENGFKLFTDEEHQNLVSNKRYYYTYQLTNEGNFDLIYKTEKNLLTDSYTKKEHQPYLFIWKDEIVGNEIHLEISAIHKEKKWYIKKNEVEEFGIDLQEIKTYKYEIRNFEDVNLGTMDFIRLKDTLEIEIPEKIIFTENNKVPTQYNLLK